MTSERTYWDELGIEWRALELDGERISPRLKDRLRRQSLAITATLALGIPLCAAGMGLGVFTVWRGWTSEIWNFVTRGVGLVIISMLPMRAFSSLLPFRKHAETQNLADMLEIGSARIGRTLVLVRVVMAACIAAASFGVAGTVIRMRAGSPPRQSPIVDLVVIALIVSFLWLYGRTLSAELGKFEYLRRVLDPEK